MAANAANTAIVMSTPPAPSSARAFPAAPNTSPKAAIASSNVSAAGSGRRRRPTRPSHARLWTARIARAAEIADHSSATTAKSATDHRVPADSFADSPIDWSTAGAIPIASPASFGALRSTVVA